jgi:hypothetical protein
MIAASPRLLTFEPRPPAGAAAPVMRAGRGQTSFRLSPAEKYEETQRWTRRIELLFAFEGLAQPIPA